MAASLPPLPTVAIGDQTVPNELLGCWRRNWIRFGDGELERDVSVIWLQTASAMGDLRIDPAQSPTETDSSCGITVVDETTTPFVTADWHDGDHGFRQQPVSRFPEKGWLRWESDTIMHELAPSGAYEEQWQKLPDSHGTAHFTALDAPSRTNLYVAGSHVFLAVERHGDQVIHEFSYGVQSGRSDQVEIMLSTHAERVGQPLQLDFEWQAQNARNP